MALVSQGSTSDFLKYTLLGIEADYEATVREAKETIRRAKERRDALIEEAREWAQGNNSTEMGLPGTLENDKALSPVKGTPHTNGAVSNDSSENVENMVSKDIVLKFVDEVMADPEVDIVTQPLIKERILAHYPVSKKNINNLRILIIYPLNELVEQGYLELVEQAKAGKPNKYRKTGKVMEASLLEP